jgi:hypothetical protein
MNDNMNEFNDLICLMAKAPKVPPSDGFTQNVMGRLPAGHGIRSGVRGMLPGFMITGADPAWLPSGRVPGKVECSFYFFISGFFYLIMALVLMAGFKAIFSSGAFADWIGLQPYVALSAALWLIAIGFLLMLDGRAAARIARYGALIFIFFAVFNGVLMQTSLRIPDAGVFIIGFAATSTIMGGILAFAVKKMGTKPV